MKKLLLILVLGCSITANLHAYISPSHYHLCDTISVEEMTDLVIGVAADFLEISAESIDGDSNVAELCGNNQSTQAMLILKWGDIPRLPLDLETYLAYETITGVSIALTLIYCAPD
jgi:hypothetical protein